MRAVSGFEAFGVRFAASRAACVAAALALAALASPPPAAAQVGVRIHDFAYAGPPAQALARLRAAAARCWKDDYDSRVHGPYREVASFATAPRGGTMRLAWYRVDADDRTRGLFKRAFDVDLAAEGAGTRVTVRAYIPRLDVGADIEAWLQGRRRCFLRRYPTPD